MSRHLQYESPLNSRYASKEMIFNFSNHNKSIVWRRLWTILGKAEKQLGLHITENQIEQMECNRDTTASRELSAQNQQKSGITLLNNGEVTEREEILAEANLFVKQCPGASPVIYLGATMDFIADNSDVVISKEAVHILMPKLARCIDRLAKFADANKSVPTLGYTHLQAAQLTTVGKRACLWLADLLYSLEEMEKMSDDLLFLGVKGSPCVEFSFVTLFDGEYSKVDQLNKLLANMAGFQRAVQFSGESNKQKCENEFACCLAGLCSSLHKICSDIRILAHEKEIEEPFEKTQIGSSAMAYKRNPMRSERCCSLARIPMAHFSELLNIADKSLCREIMLPQLFLCVDGILNTFQNIVSGLVVYPKVIERHIKEELPFMATEVIIMEMVKAGGNRQECHEEIRILSQEAAKVVKLEGRNNDLMERIRSSTYFKPIHKRLDDLLDPNKFIGCCVQQVEEFLAEDVASILIPYKDQLLGHVELHV